MFLSHICLAFVCVCLLKKTKLSVEMHLFSFLMMFSYLHLLNAFAGRLKLTVLSEDRLQMKWKEAEGPVQGYKVRVRPITGQTALVISSTLRLQH